MSARVSDMTTQTAEAQKKYVLISDVNGITNYDTVGECVPSLAELEEWVAPKLRELGVTQAMFAGEFVRASKWGDARLSDELYLVVISDREFDDFYKISHEYSGEHKLFIQVRLWETKFFSSGGGIDDLARTHYEDWKVIAL